jgi:biopolymer transport protein ExbD
MQSELNVTPFLDILLVLLIIFMFVSLAQQKLITGHLPDPRGRPGDETSIVLEVRPNATYAINTQPVAGADLARRLRAIYAERPTRTMIVRGAPGIRYQDVITAMDIARGAGVVAIGLAPSAGARERR